MPIPKPRDDESEDDFLSRCMGNDSMNEEFPDQDQRMAVCGTTWRDSLKAARDEDEDEEDKKKKDDKNMSKGLPVEIFATGVWHGIPFSVNDLATIANAFHNLKEVHKVPLKMGHNEEQEITDGLHALGWVNDVFVANGADGKPKLFAEFIDMPEIVFSAIKQKLYRKVSIELDFGVEHKDTYYPMLLSGVALLGADLPAVNNLADLDHYIDRNPDKLVASRNVKRVVFSSVAINNNSEDFDMGDKERIAELEAKLKSEQDARKESDDKIVKFEREEKERLETEKKSKVKFAREKITGLFDKAVKDMKITPAQKDKFTKLLNVDNDDIVTAIDIETVQELIEENKVSENFSHEDARGSGSGSDDEADDAGEALTLRAREIQNNNQGMDFSTALERAMLEKPQLAKQHIVATGTLN